MPEPCRSGCQKKAIAIAVRNVSGRRRWSKLGEWLRPRALDAVMQIAPWRLHDVRRSFVTGMADLGIRPDVIELCVNRTSGLRSGVAGIYNKSQLMPERKAALERWAAHIGRLISGEPAKKVVKLRTVQK